MHLRHEYVRVVARIADDRGALRVPEDVIAAWSGEELRGIAPLKEKRMTDRSVAIEAFEIELRRSSVSQASCVHMRLERGPVGGDIVRDELTEKRPTGGF
jgi:hypothetical protein